jgi:branched-chain amino acid aminotransferase
MAGKIEVLSFDQVIDRLVGQSLDYQKRYLAMYSSWFGGIVLEPSIMMIPLDDHLVHRGDGIFEAFKATAGNIYALDRHLERLERSASVVQLPLPMPIEEIRDTVVRTVRTTGAADCLIRMFVSRGPGGFTTNPYECVGSQLYILVGSPPFYPPESYEHGVTLKSSTVPIKKAYFANVKSCNYLPNVLMKKEAVDAGVDYTISLDEKGLLGEGSTENFGIVTRSKEFLIPRFDRILKGITVSRMMELTQPLVESGELSRVAEEDITPQMALEAEEMMTFGTTFDSLPVVEFDGQTIGDGRPGPYYRRFLDILRLDMRQGEGMLTPILD